MPKEDQEGRKVEKHCLEVKSHARQKSGNLNEREDVRDGLRVLLARREAWEVEEGSALDYVKRYMAEPEEGGGYYKREDRGPVEGLWQGIGKKWVKEGNQ